MPAAGIGHLHHLLCREMLGAVEHDSGYLDALYRGSDAMAAESFDHFPLQITFIFICYSHGMIIDTTGRMRLC